MPLPASLRIAITVGDPAGIGPEISQKAARDPRVTDICTPILYGPSDAHALAAFQPGVLSAHAGQVASDAIISAIDDALAGRVDAVVTAPINKEAFALAGLPWKGHTELLAHRTRAPHVAMMFHSDRLKVVLATIHIPLAEVTRALTREHIRQTIRLTAESMSLFDLARPRLALAGLNPHAGEHGLLGTEETDVLVPEVEAARAAGIDIVGPLPGDTVFVRAVRGEFDVVIACYHDQGLIPIKLVAFGSAVNVTLGLPIIRTSVDHGTAFDIAGQDRADPSSLIEAIVLAARLAKKRQTVVR